MNVYSPSQPSRRARRSHREVTFLSLISNASARSLAPSQVSVAELHFSASLWYWEATLFASRKVMFIWRACSAATASCSFNSSVRRSTNCFSISLLRSGSSPPQPVPSPKIKIICINVIIIQQKVEKTPARKQERTERERERESGTWRGRVRLGRWFMENCQTAVGTKQL